MAHNGLLDRLWKLSRGGGAPTLLQTALADSADEHADAAQSILVTVFNFAVAGDGLVGGLVTRVKYRRAA